MKRLKYLALLLCLALTLSACGKSEEESAASDDPNAVLQNEYVSVGEYKGITYTDSSVEVTDEMFQLELEAILEDYAEVTDLDRDTVEMGDYIIFDFTGYHNDELMEDGSATETVLESVGEGGYIPGFEDNLVGAKVGEKFSFDIVFPDPYENNEELSGEECTFEILVHSIHERKVPELNDDFVQNVQEYFPDVTTVEEFKEVLWDDLVAYYETQASDDSKSMVWDAVSETIVVKKLNEEAVAQYESEFRTYYESLAESNGLEFIDFIATNLGITEEEFNAEATSYAEALSTEDEVVKLIAEAEGLSVTDADLTVSYQEFADDYGMDQAAVIQYFGTEENFKRELLYEKVLDFVYENGVAQ